MKNKKTVVILLIILLTLCTLFIWSNSLKGPEESGKDSGFVVKLLKPLLDFLGIKDYDVQVLTVRKTAHFTEFFILGTILSFLVRSIGFGWFGYGLFYGLTVGVINEFIQSFTGRGSSVADVLIDFSGFCIAVLLFRVIFTFKKHKNR